MPSPAPEASNALGRSRDRRSAAVSRMCSSPSYFVPRPEEAAQAVLAVPGDDVDVEVGDALADDVVQRDERALCVHRRRASPPRAGGRWRTAGRSARRAGPRSSRGARAGSAAMWPGKSGRLSRKASETSSSKTIVRRLARRRRSRRSGSRDRRAARSGNDRQRARARCRARARRGRRCSRRRPGPGTGADAPVGVARDRLDRRLGDAVEVVDLAVAGRAEAARSAPGRRSVGMSRWAARRSTATESVPLSSATSSQTRTGLAAEVGERVGVLGDRGDPLGRVRRRPRAASGPGCAGSAR